MLGAISRRGALRFACSCACAPLLSTSVQSIAAPRARLSRACLLTSAGRTVYRSRGFGAVSVGDVFLKRRDTKSTGDPEIDFQLNRAIKIAAGILNVNPAFSFFDPDRFLGDDEYQWMNAYADGTTYVSGTRGTVAFGLTNFRSELYGYDDTGTTVMTIIAHEFGHIVQSNWGYQNAIDYGNPCGVEINADFLSGYYLGIRKLSVPSLQFEKAEQWFVRAGNPAPDRRHGNSAERLRAAQAGYRVGIEDNSLEEAVRAGWDYFGFRPRS
jgi:hypothetical protein